VDSSKIFPPPKLKIENNKKSSVAGGNTWLQERGMKELSKRDWLFVALAAFVWSGTLFVVLYWLDLMGWWW
jgi:hypothetical protein